jgi:hypothetical protein
LAVREHNTTHKLLATLVACNASFRQALNELVLLAGLREPVLGE